LASGRRFSNANGNPFNPPEGVGCGQSPVAEHQALPGRRLQVILRERLHVNAGLAQHLRSLLITHPRAQTLRE
jgi:hypothetical protein